MKVKDTDELARSLPRVRCGPIAAEGTQQSDSSEESLENVEDAVNEEEGEEDVASAAEAASGQEGEASDAIASMDVDAGATEELESREAEASTSDSDVELSGVARSAEQEPYCVLLQTKFYKQEAAPAPKALSSSNCSAIDSSFQGRTRILQLRAVRVHGKRFFIPAGTELTAHTRLRQGIFVAAGAFLGEEKTAKAAAVGQVLKGPCTTDGSGAFVLCFVGRANTTKITSMRVIPITLHGFVDPISRVSVQFARLVGSTTASDPAVQVAEVLAVDFGKYAVVENAVVDAAVSTAAADGAEQLACMFDPQHAATGAGALRQSLKQAGSDLHNQETSALTPAPQQAMVLSPQMDSESPNGDAEIGVDDVDENTAPQRSVQAGGKTLSAVSVDSFGSGDRNARAKKTAAGKVKSPRRSSSQEKSAAPRLSVGSLATPTAAAEETGIGGLDRLRLTYFLRTTLEELADSQGRLRAAYGCKGLAEKERAGLASVVKTAAKAGAKEATINVKNEVHLDEAKLARALDAALRFAAPTRKRARSSGSSEADESTNVLSVLAQASAEATTAAVKSAFKAQEKAGNAAAAAAGAAAAERPPPGEEERAYKVQQALAGIELKVAALSANVLAVKDAVKDAESRIMNCMQMTLTAISQVKQEAAQQTAASAQTHTGMATALPGGGGTQPLAQMAQQMQAWAASQAAPAQSAVAMLQPAAAASNAEEMQMLATLRQMMSSSSGQGRMQAQPSQLPMQGFNFAFPTAGRFT